MASVRQARAALVLTGALAAVLAHAAFAGSPACPWTVKLVRDASEVEKSFAPARRYAALDPDRTDVPGPLGKRIRVHRDAEGRPSAAVESAGSSFCC